MKRPRGFTLLEILVALTIAAMAFALVYRSVGMSVTLSASSRDRLEALAVVRSLAAQMTAQPGALRDARGEFAGWRWTLTLRPVAVTWQAVPAPGGPFDPARFAPERLPPLVALDWTLTSDEQHLFHFTTYTLGEP